MASDFGSQKSHKVFAAKGYTGLYSITTKNNYLSLLLSGIPMGIAL